MAPSPYGSIEGNDPEKATSGFASNEDSENRDERDYNLGESYYLKDHSDKRSKFLRALLPILIALAIVGGVSYFFFRDFNKLYPGPGSSESNDDYVAPVSVTDDSTQETKSNGEESHAQSSSSCAANDKCADLGLSGDCCPSSGGFNLACCD
mmetsp:Transcript_12228/g.23067  ORF Transcript_12228/g.23067 Transcript_12228/m.23067 type:complete len:152 (-) Transcript_12228:71-526(-)|eukprot:CAMPEP_0197455836 /NCGR_PEP_ID=MMETSP1175-20131217/41784_1 /TAXON_ID=1003142 /ORGANISM="Triceratium dubium, Strain CCMP147" /LENGTH=151 /DNA_ID=CAMNT_0042989797 /DNA_START=133 /DNA_END=588 /DNA_ORIENTATION=+